MRVFAPGEKTALAFAEQGEGRPLVFVHGWAAHGGFFAEQSPLAQRFRVIAPDLPGHGGSPPPQDASIACLADNVHAFMAALDLRDAICVGWSMGAAVLWNLIARRGAARIGGVVAIDMSPRIINDSDWRLGLKSGFGWDDHARALIAMRADWAGFAKALAQRIGAPGAIQAPWVSAAFKANQPAIMADLWDGLAHYDGRADLAACTPPMVVAHGTQSQLYDAATARFVAASAPDAVIATFQESGHAPHLEQPEHFNALIEAFAASVPEPGAGKLCAKAATAAWTL
jgi:pimeloyl-[acyl-carrier protein] methyl ester esterase